MLLNLECDLKSVVFGQEEAINKLVDAVFISKSGLREGNKTLGSFLFTGPSGVGKCLAGDQQVTLQVSEELAKILHSLSSP
jgi:ATP-dependent Clp protease ATP-binding subunit ClpA